MSEPDDPRDACPYCLGVEGINPKPWYWAGQLWLHDPMPERRVCRASEARTQAMREAEK